MRCKTCSGLGCCFCNYTGIAAHVSESAVSAGYATACDQLIQEMDRMTDFERIRILNRLHGHYCKHCGCVHYGQARDCQCWNDE